MPSDEAGKTGAVSALPPETNEEENMELSSSPFNAPKYDAEAGTLDIYAEDGAWYRFMDVPKDVWEALSESSYKSLYFNDYIVNQYKWILLVKK